MKPSERTRDWSLGPSTGKRAAALLVVIVVAIALAACAGRTVSTSTSTTTEAKPSAAQLWEKCLAWIRDGNTQVTFDQYTVLYGEQGRVGQLDLPFPVSGEPLISTPCWWADDTDYFQQELTGPPTHVTVAMATQMSAVKVPTMDQVEADAGYEAIAIIRYLADPYRLLRVSHPVESPVLLPDSTWSLQGETTVNELLGNDLPARTLTELSSLGSDIQVTLELKADGTIVSMKWSTGSTDISGGYAWSKTPDPPSLPHAWVEMEASVKSTTEQVSAVAKQAGFDVYWLGEKYQEAPVFAVSIQDKQVVITYMSTSGAPRGGHVLFESSVSEPPQGQSPLNSFKFLESFGSGEDEYAVYVSATEVGKQIVVRKGGTLISVLAERSQAKDNAELLAIAAALEKAQP